MSRPPNFEDIFAVMAAASVGNRDARVDLPEEPDLEDTATKFAIALNLLLDDLALRYDELNAQLQKVQAQQQTIQQLSLPILELDHQTLLLPLIGKIDAERTTRLREALLAKIHATRAKAVLLDLTGVPTLDLPEAKVLIDIAEAAAMMGASTLVTGISGSVAEAMVAGGLNFEKLRVLADLREGMAALARIPPRIGTSARHSQLNGRSI